MALDNMDRERNFLFNEARPIQALPATVDPTGATDEELVADTDEPPDDVNTLEYRTSAQQPTRLNAKIFTKKASTQSQRKQSLLSQALITSDSEHNIEEDLMKDSQISRGMSSASVWSNNSTASTAELTSDGGCTSPGTRASSPSPPLPPASFHGLPPLFTKPNFDKPLTIRHDEENVGPLQKAPPVASDEKTIETSLGRRRCITFACDGKTTPKPALPSPPKSTLEHKVESKRPCAIRFLCSNKASTEKCSETSKAKPVRQRSPAPRRAIPQDTPRASPRSHRDSDSTVRNTSPRNTRKPSPIFRPRKNSDDSDLGRAEATRFNEFTFSAENDDEWVQESTCHRSRLTVNDTLKVENRLRQLAEEVAEEEAIEDDVELEDEDIDDEVEQYSEIDGHSSDREFRRNWPEEDDSDEGFRSDDEEGFAHSGDESDDESDYEWWTHRHTNAGPINVIDHIRPSAERTFSDSSVGSAESLSGKPHGRLPQSAMKRRKSRPLSIRPKSPELPDSTDFVCGTLDEDRPLEAAYMSAIEARRAAKHRPTPQDIDPTFPTSDPEIGLDEEDEDDDGQERYVEESDHQFFIHGPMEALNDGARGRAANTTSHRVRSPPPQTRRSVVYRSPPPRKLFGASPKRLRSPPPAVRLRSPPPTRRPSFAKTAVSGTETQFVGLGARPQPIAATSLPRTTLCAITNFSEDDEETSKELPTRGAIAIKAGLEQKRLRCKEKLYQKHCRKADQGKLKPQQPGKGCERMRKHYMKSNGLLNRQPKDHLILSI
jgi:hypothetical protein